MTTPTWSLRRLHALDDAQIDELAGVLMDCVEGGASVSFMQPLLPRGGLCDTTVFYRNLGGYVHDFTKEIG